MLLVVVCVNNIRKTYSERNKNCFHIVVFQLFAHTSNNKFLVSSGILCCPLLSFTSICNPSCYNNLLNEFFLSLASLGKHTNHLVNNTEPVTPNPSKDNKDNNNKTEQENAGNIPEEKKNRSTGKTSEGNTTRKKEEQDTHPDSLQDLFRRHCFIAYKSCST